MSTIEVIDTKHNDRTPGPSNGEEMIALRKKTFPTCFATEWMVRIAGSNSWHRLYESYDKQTMKCIRKFVKIKGKRIDIA